MRKLIAIPRELVEKINEVAEKEGWSFSRTICYLTSMGLKCLSEIYKDNPDKYNEFKTNFNFDVDNPKRRIFDSDY